MTRLEPPVLSSRRRARRDAGQVLVLFVGGLLTLLLIVALVIDLGFSFAIRRQEQDIADPAAIAAARFIRSGPGQTPDLAGMAQAACAYARKNGLFPGGPQCIPANDPDGTTLTVNYPPSTSGGTFSGRPGFVEVIIGRQYHSFFANVIGMSRIGIASSAVAAFSAGDSNSSSLIALDPGNSCQAGKTHGTGDITIHPAAGVTNGGYVHVNSTCSTGSADGACGNSGQGGFDIVGSGTVTSPHTYVSGTCKANGGLAGPLDEGAVQIGDPLLELPPPTFGTPTPGAECGIGSGVLTTPTGPGSAGCRFNPGTINLLPGVYYGGWDIRNNVTLVLAPGIYVIAGGGVKLNAGGSITDVEGTSGTPAPVMIYNTDNPVTHTGQAALDFSAQATLKLHGLDSGPYRGIVVWNDGAGSNPSAAVTLGGQVSLDLAGTIYNPKGPVTMEGGSGLGSTAAVQIIAWQFDVGGNANLDMPYDPSKLYQFDEKGLVH